MPVSITLEQGARRAGAYRWAEARLFEILGGWVTSTPEQEAKLLLDRHSQHHAWRARQWWDRLPLLAGVDRDALVDAPSPDAAAAADALAGTEGTVARLAALYRVALPRLVAAYTVHRQQATPLSDGATLRTLDLVGRDAEGDWREGEVLLQGLIVDVSSAQVAASSAGRLEALVVAAAFRPGDRSG